MVSTFDLDDLRDEVLGIFASRHRPEKQFGYYEPPPDSDTGLLYESTDVVLAMVIMNVDPLSVYDSAGQLQAWADYINSFQNEEGHCENASHSDLHRNGMVISALGPLRARQKYRVSQYDNFNTPEKLVRWLESLDWVNAYGMSHLVWGGPCYYSFSRECTAEWLDTCIDWLNDNLDPQTGWWRKGVEHDVHFAGLGCGCHIWPIYQHHQRPFPYPEAVIDSILALQNEDGGIVDNWVGYIQLDALYGLAYMQQLAPQHRRDDVLAAVNRYADRLLERLDELWPYFKGRHAHTILAIVGILGCLNQLLPDRFVTAGEAWTDIFSDIRFFQTAQVEAI